VRECIAIEGRAAIRRARRSSHKPSRAPPATAYVTLVMAVSRAPSHPATAYVTLVMAVPRAPSHPATAYVTLVMAVPRAPSHPATAYVTLVMAVRAPRSAVRWVGGHPPAKAEP